jgi:hypothetical protein
MSDTQAQLLPGLNDRLWDDDCGAAVPKGAFEVTTDEKSGQRWFWFKCPGACASIAPIALRPVAAATRAGEPSWELSGTDAAPTLKPSINHVGCWHGWLTDGVFKIC